MRIAYVCCDPGIPLHGVKGASIHVRELSGALAALGHEVAIFARRLDEAPRAVSQGQSPGHGHAGHAPGTVPRFAPAVHEGLGGLPGFRPDVVYERYSLLATEGGELARRLGVPHLVEVNAPLVDEAVAHRGLRHAAEARAAELHVLRNADRLVAVSSALVRWLERLGVERRRIVLLPNAVDVSRYGRPAPARSAVPVVGFLGTLKPWHDVESLVRAMPGLDARLLVVGDGPERARLERLAASTGVDATFTGAVQHERVPALLASMDVAVVPYARRDVYFSPLKLFEYLAAGRAVVAADAGDVGCCVKDGESGVLYPPGDVSALAASLRSLIGNPLLRERLGRAGRAHVRRHHTWERNARAVADLVPLREAA